MRPGEAGSYAVRAGRARTFREKRTDHRRRPGLGHSDLSPEKHSRELMSLHANVFPEKGRNVQVLAFDDGRFAFLETSARDRLELHNFLLRLDAFFLWRLRLFFYNRFFLWWNQTRGGLFN